MFQKIRNIFIIISLAIFIFFVSMYYFSEQNIIITNKSRSSYAFETVREGINLPILKNDTNNIIVYRNDLEEFKKERKKRLWEKLISN